MSKSLVLGVMVAGLLAGLPTALSAALLPTMTLYTVDDSWVSSATNDRAPAGNSVGAEFMTPDASQPRSVTHVGFIDKGGDGLAAAHRVRLWQMSGSTYTLLVDQVINPGEGTLWDSFRWVELATPVTLPASSHFALSATVNTADTWKDAANPSPGNQNAGTINTYDWQTGYAQLYNGGATEYTPWAKYGNYSGDPTIDGQAPPGSSPGSWTWNRMYVAANIGLPEPASLVLCLGALACLRRRRSR